MNGVKDKTVTPLWQMLIAAFCGGICLSLAELMGMLKAKEAIDLYFFGGMIVAGILGIGGYFIAGPANVRSAVAAGISAPQLLAGFLKAVPVATQALALTVATAVAQPPVTHDSVSVTVVVVGTQDTLRLVGQDGKVHLVADTTQLRIPRSDTMTVSGFGFKNAPVVLGGGRNFTVMVDVEQVESMMAQFTRGMFAQQAKTSAMKKLSVKVEQHR